VASIGAMGLTDADRMYRTCIAAAQHRLWIANAYFSPPNAILQQLEHKARNGVDVRVLAPGPVHDQRIVRASQRSVYPRLLRAGVRIWEYRPSMMHSKTLLADDWLAMVGSCNLDSLSLNKLAEGSLVMADPAMNATLAEDFVADCEVSNAQKVPGRWRRTGPFKRLARRITQVAGADR
jgi:cardiolipin synthase